MSEWKREQKEQQWGDRIPEQDEQTDDGSEKTYRDGSAVNECWANEKENM